MELYISVLIGLLGIAIGIFFGLRGFRTQVVPTLSKIEEHTRSIKDIKDIAVKLDERTDLILKYAFPTKGTVEGALKNLGKVRVTAEPHKEGTNYLIEVEKPLLKEGLITIMSSKYGLYEKWKELFREEAKIRLISPTRGVFYLPSTDPKICTEFISFFLKWLDSEYFKSLEKELKAYEEIAF